MKASKKNTNNGDRAGQGSGTLLIYELGDRPSELYFVPDGASIPDQVRDALLVVNGNYSNCADQTPEQDRACEIISSARYHGDYPQGYDQDVLGTLAWCSVSAGEVVNLQVNRIVISGFIP